MQKFPTWRLATPALCAASLLFLWLSTAVVSAETPVSTGPRTGAWRHQESANFEVWTPSAVDAAKVANSLESHLERQRVDWCPNARDNGWQPKCVVVVHGNLSAYRAAIGSAHDTSVGMSTFAAEKGSVTSRRIDLRCDADGWLHDALPHELTHLVLADAFNAQPPAPWIGEGLAVLAESPEKQSLRAAVLARAVAARATIPTRDLLKLEGFPAAAQRDTFYSQSASVARCLIQREGCEQFCEFVRQSRERGPEAALRHVYGLDGTRDLETLWRAETVAHSPSVHTRKALVDGR